MMEAERSFTWDAGKIERCWEGEDGLTRAVVLSETITSYCRGESGGPFSIKYSSKKSQMIS